MDTNALIDFSSALMHTALIVRTGCHTSQLSLKDSVDPLECSFAEASAS